MGGRRGAAADSWLDCHIRVAGARAFSATMAYAAWDLGHDLIAMLFAALAGASLGFIPFNLPHARRLLGDSGAYFLGFTIGALSIAGFVDTTGRVPLYISLVALGLPVLDAGVAFLRRYLAGAHEPAAWRRSGEERWWKATGGVYRSAPYVPRAIRAPVPRPGTSSPRGAFRPVYPASPGSR